MKPKGGLIFTIYKTMCSRRQSVEQELKSIEETLREFPDGKLICVQNGPYTKWFESDGHTSTYLPRKDRNRAELLARKKYLTLKRDYLMKEQKAINSYLRHHPQKCPAESLLTDTSAYSDLLSPTFTSRSQKISDWMNAPYEQNPAHPEQLLHKTVSGMYVRSKSEAIIALLLSTHQIPFRYECALTLGNITVYPDFTIRHPVTDEIFYWEHFGMMDHEPYRSNALSKLELYASKGIYPSQQLITTYETKEYPLDSGLAEHLIRHYFL